MVFSHIAAVSGYDRVSIASFHSAVSPKYFGPRPEKTCVRGCANNKGADQPAHPRSLISAFVIRLLKSTISRLATSEISII